MIKIEDVKKLIKIAKENNKDFFEVLDFDTFLQKVNEEKAGYVKGLYDLSEFCCALIDAVLFDCIEYESSQQQRNDLMITAKDNNWIEKNSNDYEENSYIICCNLFLK